MQCEHDCLNSSIGMPLKAGGFGLGRLFQDYGHT